MTNNSGKFILRGVSHAEADAQDVPETGTDTPVTPPANSDKSTTDGTLSIPECPESIMQKVRYYLGEWWWLWIVALVIYFANKK